MAVPTEYTGGAETDGASLPPTPAAKDTPRPQLPEQPMQVEGIEPAPHPETKDVEGPVTTTVAVSAEEATLPTSESNGGLSTTSEDKLDEISLDGESGRGDEAEEDIDLS